MIVDTKNRAKAASLIREFSDGQITNDEFDEQYPRSTHDPALQNIWQCLWAFWSDLETHRLEKEHALSAQQQALVERCIAFLNTDLEYLGPVVKVDFLAWLKRGWQGSKAAFTRRSSDRPENQCWPFASEQQYRQHSSKDTP